jgi:hypothetical protein
MNEDTEGRTGVAGVIFDSGWQQGSIFQPPEEYVHKLPANLKFDPATEWLVVCTQTCSLCSKDALAEPMAEVMVAKPIQKFAPRNTDAMGKNNKCLHVEVNSLPGSEGLACYIGRRAFIPKVDLAKWKPSVAWMPVLVTKAFRGWLAHHYIRVALPDRLVERMRLPGGVREIILGVLQSDVDGRPCAEGVATFFLDWRPERDISADEAYYIRLLVVCKDSATWDFMTNALSDLHATQRKGLSVKGVVVTHLDIETEDNITLTFLETMHRFNEWDELSNLPERLASIEKVI